MIQIEHFLQQRFCVAPRAVIRNAILSGIHGTPGAPRLVVHVNLHSLYLRSRDTSLAAVLDDPTTFALFDGVALRLACRWRRGVWWPDVNGNDLVPSTLRVARPGTRVGLVGAASGIAAEAADRLRRTYPGIEVVLVADGFRDMQDETALVLRLRDARVDCLLLGLGSPLQEVVAYRWRRLLDLPLIWCVGGLFDTVSGRVARAPIWVRSLRLEWMWRLGCQPARTWRRVFIEGPWLIRCLLGSSVRWS
jgi:exopolysaccharide biosynthesis WecB/TagA/CpsF family protein